MSIRMFAIVVATDRRRSAAGSNKANERNASLGEALIGSHDAQYSARNSILSVADRWIGTGTIVTGERS
jgi:hypothetical protein